MKLAICVFFLTAGYRAFFYRQGYPHGSGMFNVRDDHNVCCVHEGQTGADETRESALTGVQSKELNNMSLTRLRLVR